MLFSESIWSYERANSVLMRSGFQFFWVDFVTAEKTARVTFASLVAQKFRTTITFV